MLSVCLSLSPCPPLVFLDFFIGTSESPAPVVKCIESGSNNFFGWSLGSSNVESQSWTGSNSCTLLIWSKKLCGSFTARKPQTCFHKVVQLFLSHLPQLLLIFSVRRGPCTFRHYNVAVQGFCFTCTFIAPHTEESDRRRWDRSSVSELAYCSDLTKNLFVDLVS